LKFYSFLFSFFFFIFNFHLLSVHAPRALVSDCEPVSLGTCLVWPAWSATISSCRFGREIINPPESDTHTHDENQLKTIDVVSQIYFTTKTFVKAKVEPVLKRADSVKQLTMLDDALSVADKYVDKYLPDKDPSEDDKPSKRI